MHYLNMESYKYDVFISYSRRDTNVVEKICKAFDDNKISYFIDRQGIGGGLEFPKVIAEAILSSQIFLFIASENSYKSKFAQSEVVFAFNKKQKSDIIPYIIDDSALPSELELTFSATIWRRKSKHPIETTLVDDVLKRVGKTKIVEEEGKHEGLRSYEKCNVPFTFDVFISYSRKDYVDDAGNVLDNNILSKIKDTLKANGISYWFDEEGIYSGDEFASVLTNAIRNSRIFLFISSINSNQSKWTSNEISTAFEFKKPIIPFRIDNSPYNDSVMMKIISFDYIECKDEQKAINKLLRAVEHILPLSKKDNMRQEEIVKGKTEDYSSSGVEVHIDVDADCDLYRFKTFIQHLIAGEDNVLHMNHGKYKLEFVSTDFPEVKSNMVYNLATGITCDFIEIAIKEKINGFISKQKTEGLKCKSGKKDKITINAFSPYDDIEEKQYDIFICFRRESGRNLARIFQLSLEKKYRVFMDYNALPYNEFELSVADIIRKSSVFLLILSKGSLDRCVYENDWVRKEILYAEQFGCHIVPVGSNR